MKSVLQIIVTTLTNAKRLTWFGLGGVKKEKRENIQSVDKKNEKEKGGICTFFVEDKRKGE